METVEQMLAHVAEATLGSRQLSLPGRTSTDAPMAAGLPSAMSFSKPRHRLRGYPDADRPRTEMRQQGHAAASDAVGAPVDTLLAKPSRTIQPTFVHDYPLRSRHLPSTSQMIRRTLSASSSSSAEWRWAMRLRSSTTHSNRSDAFVQQGRAEAGDQEAQPMDEDIFRQRCTECPKRWIWPGY